MIQKAASLPNVYTATFVETQQWVSVSLAILPSLDPLSTNDKQASFTNATVLAKTYIQIKKYKPRASKLIMNIFIVLEKCSLHIYHCNAPKRGIVLLLLNNWENAQY